MHKPFPLQWPVGTPRTPHDQRTTPRFMTGMLRSLDALRQELDRMGATEVVITSDLPTRSNGMPYGDAADNGIAVWFQLEGQERCLACDRWVTPGANIRAISLTVEALRGMDRWGVADVVGRAMRGFAALPPGDPDGQRQAPNPATSPGTRDWREVLGVTRDVVRACQSRTSNSADFRYQLMGEVRTRFRSLIKAKHPDIGTDDGSAASIIAAFDDAKRAIEAGSVYA